MLGRVSKNQKTDYIAKSTNGYFDNPIISRHHAVLENRSGAVLFPSEPR
jgi:pSer/pThr/pTyr-binding forkhead associated (FHA) protein